MKKGMYGLKQAARLAYDALVKTLKMHGCAPDKYCPHIWKHESRDTIFCLCVDDFGVKYVGKQHAKHLMSILKTYYAISHDWEEKSYLGLDLDWDYKKRRVHLSILNYGVDALKRFHHLQPRKLKNQPYPHVKLTYVSKKQYAADLDTSALISKADKKVTGTFLCYAHKVNPTMLTALGSIAKQHDNPTANTT